MKLLVCVKQVPEIDHISGIADPGGSARLSPVSDYRMNRFDEFAVEAALEIAAADDLSAAVRIDAITVGPERCQEVVRRALGMGTHRGIHLLAGSDDDPTGISPAVVAAGIARYAAQKNYDLILCGTLSEDGMHAQVGPMLAGFLDRPVIIQVAALRMAGGAAAVRVEKEIEGGDRECLRLRLPAVVCVQPGINRPRYPALSKLLRANAQELETLRIDRPDCVPVHGAFSGLSLPHSSRAGHLLEGPLERQADTLLTVLKERAILA